MSEVLITVLPPASLSAADPGSLTVMAGSGEAGDVREIRLDELAEQAAQSGTRLFLVFSSTDVLITQVTLTRKQARQLQRALPYLLEENLLKSPEALWYAWGKPAGNHYPVLACDREAIERLRNWFIERQVLLAGATSDASLLAYRAPLCLRDERGVLLLPAADQALALERGEEEAVRRALAPDEGDWEELEGERAALEAFRAGRAHGAWVELLHDELRPPAGRGRGGQALAQWRPVALFAAAAVVFTCVLLGVQQWQYGQAAQDMRSEAAVLYKELFPGDRATARLRAQFQNRLDRLGRGGGQAGFLEMLTPVGSVLADNRSQGVTARRLQYNEREDSLLVELDAEGYDSVETVRKQLSENGLDAEIATARNDGEGVRARLRVRQG